MKIKIEIVSLGKVILFIRNGLSIKQDKATSGIPITRIESIATGSINPNKFGYADIENAIKYSDKILQDGDILISHINSADHIGKSAIYENKPPILIHGMNLLCMRAKKEKVIPRFLLFFTKSNFFKQQLPKITNQSVNQSSFSATNFKEKIQIPLPSLEDQKRIVKILDVADVLRQKRKQSIILLDNYLKSVFLEMFGNPVTNPRKIKTAKIKEMGQVFTGNTPPRNEVENYGSFIEWIKSDNINNDSHYLTKASEYLSKSGSKKARIVPAGSMLVTCIAGSKSCIGNSGMADREVSFNQQINAIVPNADVDQRFLYAQILFNKKLFQNAATDGMKGMLSKSKFSEIELLKPDMVLQKKYSDLFLRAESLKQKMLTQVEELEDQFQALMQKAFKGEL